MTPTPRAFVAQLAARPCATPLSDDPTSAAWKVWAPVCGRIPDHQDRAPSVDAAKLAADAAARSYYRLPEPAAPTPEKKP